MNIQIINNEIFISEEDWTNIVTNNDKDDIITALNDVVENNNISFPIKNNSLASGISSFVKLQNENSLDCIKRGDFFHRYEYKYQLSDIYIQSTHNGLHSSNFFTFNSRMECDSINSPSPERTWNSYKFRKSLFGALFSLKAKEVNPKTISSCISMRKYIASQFKPSCAKCLYELFDAKNILDFSSGWGDRLIGFLASPNTKKYIGIDPNIKLVPQYNGIINQFNTNKTVKMINAAAEDVTLTDKFDFIFTSPPYFNIEKYTHCSNQSFKRYKKIDKWLQDFLFTVINNSWNALEDGGVMAINIGDVYSGHTVNKICDPMNDYIASLNNSNYLGCIGYKMQKRLQSKSFKTGVFGEPIWLWKKNDKTSLEDIIKTKGIII